MKRRILILFFGLFSCFVSNAQIKLVFDELRIDQLVYINTPKEYYDSITDNDIKIMLHSEYEQPMFGIELTIENNTDNVFVFDTVDYDYYCTFEINNKQYKAWVFGFHYNKILPAFSKGRVSIIAPDLFSFIRDKETNKRIDFPYSKLKDRNDYSNIIYSILPTFRMVYKQKDLEIISDSPNKVIIEKYSQSNLDHLKETMEEGDVSDDEFGD